MSKNKKDKIKISFIGSNSENVTGSMILVESDSKKILLECGLIQGHNSIEDYKTNSKSFPFKSKNIDYVFLNHIHIDHSGRIPKLIHDGFEGKIITTPITAKLMKPMLLDSCKIIQKDADYISKKRGKEFEPFYTEDDVYKALDSTYEYGYDNINEIDDEISFRFLKNSHIVGAAQLELFIKNKSGHINKILYTSDLGMNKIKNHYVDETERCTKANILISECTYGSSSKNTKVDRNKDLEKIKTTVEQVCINAKGRILIPVFSLARSQQVLTNLFDLYGQDKNFKIPIYVDSPLIWKITQVYKEVLTGENKELFDKVCDWKNVRFIKDYNESKLCVNDKSPKIVLSSSGFLNHGRSCGYLKEYISHVKDCIITVGYSSPSSIAGKIKSGQKNITIDGKTYKNKCGLTTLNSFSSHIQQDELLNYLKGIQSDKVYLVHSDESSKLEFKELLENEYEKMNKTTKVIAVNRSTVCSL